MENMKNMTIKTRKQCITKLTETLINWDNVESFTVTFIGNKGCKIYIYFINGETAIWEV